MILLVIKSLLRSFVIASEAKQSQLCLNGLPNASPPSSLAMTDGYGNLFQGSEHLISGTESFWETNMINHDAEQSFWGTNMINHDAELKASAEANMSINGEDYEEFLHTLSTACGCFVIASEAKQSQSCLNGLPNASSLPSLTMTDGYGNLFQSSEHLFSRTESL